MMIHANAFPGQSSVKMEPQIDVKVPENATTEVPNGNVDDLQHFNHIVNEMSSHIDMLEHKIQEVEYFFSSNRKKQNKASKKKEKARPIVNIKTLPSQSMLELMSQFGKILNQVILNTGVLDEDLGLHNCSELDGKPRDFSTIKRKMEIKDGSGYNHVQDIYTDVRSILKNAKKYNDEKSDAHVTANTLIEIFQEKWYNLLPQVLQEDERIQDEQTGNITEHVQMAKDICGELNDVEDQLNEVKDLVIRKCRKMTTLEKRELGRALTKLPADDLNRALEIVEESNPAFQAGAEVVDLDIDAQSEYTLRRLKYYILDTLQARDKPGIVEAKTETNDNAITNKAKNFKRKREILVAAGKPSKKKIKTHN